MSISREAIVSGLQERLNPANVITEEAVLKACSADRYKKYQWINDVYTNPLPAAVVKPQSAQQVADVLKFLNENGINAVPRTGGSATEGGLETVRPDSVVIDGSDMNQILHFDPYNMQVTVQCGVLLENLENYLRARGYTTGHSPQSKPLAQLGGLTATRSIGQFSTLYGGIEQMLCGAEVVFPDGTISRIKPIVRRAAGPDVLHLILGNEGALCFITEVTLRIHRYFPQNNTIMAYAVGDMKTGFEILREVMVQGYRPSVARLYDAADADTHFADYITGHCILIFMAEGNKLISGATALGIRQIAEEQYNLKPLDSAFFSNWLDHLNWTEATIAAEVERIRQTKNMSFTTEVSGNWDQIYEIYAAAVKRIVAEVPDITLMGGHSSHSYINGTNMYFVYRYNVVDCTPEEEPTKYHEHINRIIVEETLKRGGSMCHHHGIGKVRAPYAQYEYGTSYHMLEKIKAAFDPNGIMNAGTIIPLEPKPLSL